MFLTSCSTRVFSTRYLPIDVNTYKREWTDIFTEPIGTKLTENIKGGVELDRPTGHVSSKSYTYTVHTHSQIY